MIRRLALVSNPDLDVLLGRRRKSEPNLQTEPILKIRSHRARMAARRGSGSGLALTSPAAAADKLLFSERRALATRRGSASAAFSGSSSSGAGGADKGNLGLLHSPPAPRRNILSSSHRE